MSPQLVNGYIYALPRTPNAMDLGEKMLLEKALHQARENLGTAANALTVAMQRLTLHDHDSKILSNAMWQLLHRSFQVGNEPSTKKITDRLKSISKVLEKTRRGLQGPVEIVDLPKSTFKENRGLIAKLADARTYAAIPPGRTPKIVRTRPIGELGYVRGAIPAVAGPIHIAFGYLFDQEMSAWTIIHEATHKFAGTGDHAYWDDHQEQWDRQLEVSKAIKNADSYAMFAMDYQNSFLWG